MDFTSDTAHLFDDSKFGDECTKLDIKNRLETKHQNKREDRNYMFTAKILDRNSSLVKKDHEREMKLIRDGLQDIYVKTPYFQTFWKLNNPRNTVFEVEAEEIKAAVVKRILGRRSVEVVPEDRELDITGSRMGDMTCSRVGDLSTSSRMGDSSRMAKKTVRRSKSEPAFSEILTDTTSKHHTAKVISNSSSSSCIFPVITDLQNSNKELAKYTPVIYPKLQRTKKTPTGEVQPITADFSKSKAQTYVKKAKYHVRTLDNIYYKRTLPVKEPDTVEDDTGVFYDELPENSMLRAHFISQTNSRKRLGEKTVLSDINETFHQA